METVEITSSQLAETEKDTCNYIFINGYNTYSEALFHLLLTREKVYFRKTPHEDMYVSQVGDNLEEQ